VLSGWEPDLSAFAAGFRVSDSVGQGAESSTLSRWFAARTSTLTDPVGAVRLGHTESHQALRTPAPIAVKTHLIAAN